MDVRDSVWLDISPTELGDKRTRVMHMYQMIRVLSNACDQKNVAQIKKIRSKYTLLQKLEIVQTVTEDVLSKQETKDDFKYKIIDFILYDAYTNYQDDNNEMLFFAAARFELLRLKEVIKELKRDSNTAQNINQTKYSDSVIIFLLKYADVRNENFLECMKILVEAGVDINQFDIRGKTAIDYVAGLYEYNKHLPNVVKTLKEVVQLFLMTGIFKPDIKNTLEFLTDDIKIDIEKYVFFPMHGEAQLFYLLSKNKIDEFLAFKDIKKFIDTVDEENRENTLLQLASKKTDNMLPVVQFLLKNGADPNKITKWNPLTPLELAGTNNNKKIFEELLKHKKTEITLKQYNNFVRWRSHQVKVKLFELLLESNKLDPTFAYEKTGNTPLHYAVIFCHKKAIQNLLKLHSSLITRNKFGQCALDIIDSEDLEKYFDSCLALDNYTPYFSDQNYKMRFRFHCLVDGQTAKEVKVISKIGKNPDLERLLTHPFIHTFITLKWFRIKIYFWVVLFFQMFMFLLLSFFFYRLPNSSTAEYCACIFFSIINVLLKAPILLFFKIKNNRPIIFAFNKAALHGSLEILLMVTIIGSFFQNQFRAFLFVEMAVSFLLTAGYHPRLSKWSLMLQQVFNTFTILLIFFSLIVVAFSVGFNILFPGEAFFQNFFGAIFRTYIMTTGEFNIEDDSSFVHSGFGGHLLFLLFAMSMALVIVNFWTGVAVTDIERIEKNSEINASKNVTIFMLFVEYLYTLSFLRRIRKHIPNPLLFLRISDEGFTFHDATKCEVDFFVNKDNQFEEKSRFPSKIDKDCFNKIRCHYYKLAKVPNEQEILTKLDELSKMLTEIRSKCFRNNQGDPGGSDTRPQRNYRKKEPKK